MACLRRFPGRPPGRVFCAPRTHSSGTAFALLSLQPFHAQPRQFHHQPVCHPDGCAFALQPLQIRVHRQARVYRQARVSSNPPPQLQARVSSVPQRPPGVHLDYGQSVAYQAADALASSTSNDVLLCQALELELAIQRAETVLGDFKVAETGFDGPEICFEYFMFDGEVSLLCEPVTVPVPTPRAKLAKFGDYDEDEFFAEPSDEDSGLDSDYDYSTEDEAEIAEWHCRQAMGDEAYEKMFVYEEQSDYG